MLWLRSIFKLVIVKIIEYASYICRVKNTECWTNYMDRDQTFNIGLQYYSITRFPGCSRVKRLTLLHVASILSHDKQWVSEPTITDIKFGALGKIKQRRLIIFLKNYWSVRTRSSRHKMPKLNEAFNQVHRHQTKITTLHLH